MTAYLNFGGGVNSVSLLALMVKGTIQKADYVVFADTGAEKDETYAYMEYFEKISPLPIITVKSKEGSLLDYCLNKKILPQRFLRWCSDRWKHVPLDKFREANGFNENEDKLIIGIAGDEAKRAKRWINDKGVKYPLIELGIDRSGCISLIKEQGWKVPPKSGCFFCPFAKLDEFADLRKHNPAKFELVVKLERDCLERLKKAKIKGWFHDSYPLTELLNRKRPATCEGQMCLYCMG